VGLYSYVEGVKENALLVSMYMQVQL